MKFIKSFFLISAFSITGSVWACSFTSDTQSDAAQLKGVTVRTSSGEFIVESVSRAFQLHSSGRFAVCNNVNLELSSVDTQEKSKMTFSTNLGFEKMRASHLLASMENEGVYLTRPLTVKKSSGYTIDLKPDYRWLMRSIQQSSCLQESTDCSF